MKKILKIIIIGLVVAVAMVCFCGCDALDRLIWGCDHSAEWECSIEEANCLKEGSKKWTCTECGEIVETEVLPIVDEHDWKMVEAVEPTCSSVGWEAGLQCAICEKRNATVIEKLPHTIMVIKGSEADCEKSGISDGEFCTICEEMIVEQSVVEPLGHACNVYSNSCSRCGKENVYREITTYNDLMDYDATFDAIINLEYCIGSREHSLYQTVPQECNYIRLIGNPNKTYALRFIIENRTKPFRIDLVNTNLAQNSILLESYSKEDIHLGLYGESSSIVALKANNGSNGKIGTMDGSNGANGCNGIDVKGNLTITLAANTCKIKGGDGGDGGNGASVGYNNGYDGGNGGNGGYGIMANSITIVVEDGYSSSNLIIAGGAGGLAGKGGSGGLFYSDGRNGYSGSSGSATSTQIIYK